MKEYEINETTVACMSDSTRFIVQNKENFTVRISPGLKKRAHKYALENNYESTSGLIRELLEHNIDPKFRREQLKKDLIELSRDPDIQHYFKLK